MKINHWNVAEGTTKVMPCRYYPQLPKGPQSREELFEDYMPSAVPALGFVLYVIVAVLVGNLALLVFGQLGMVAAIGGIWAAGLVISWRFFMAYMKKCIKRSQSLARLPWRQGWTWRFLFFTFAWFPVWVISFGRLCFHWKHVRSASIQQMA